MQEKKDYISFFEVLSSVLIRCFWGGSIILLFWFLFFIMFGDWVYSIHSGWFDMTKQQFDFICYVGMIEIKLFIFLLFLIPYICLRTVIKKIV